MCVCVYVCVCKREREYVWGGGEGHYVHWEDYAMGSKDSSVVRALDSRLKGHGFESLHEQQDNFLLQGQLSVLTLISVSVPPLCYCSST